MLLTAIIIYLIAPMGVGVLISRLVKNSKDFAYWKANIYELVADASISLLFSLFVLLTAGLYGSKSSNTGALWSIFSGMGAYLLFIFIVDIHFPAHLAALTVSLMGMLAGSYLYPKTKIS